MNYSLDQFIADNNLDRSAIERHKRRMLDSIRLQELKDARKSRGITQKELAEQMGVSQARISTLESGDVCQTKVETLIRYAQGIGADLRVSMTMPDGVHVNLV